MMKICSITSFRKTWRTLGKLNRGRGMMPGVGFIGGELSIIGESSSIQS